MTARGAATRSTATRSTATRSTATRGAATRSTATRAAVGAAILAAALTGCSSEIQGMEEDSSQAEQSVAVSSPVPTGEGDPGANIDAPADPDPVTFALDECMQVDFSGVGARFVAVVPCDEPHHAEAYHSIVVEEEQGPAAIVDMCSDELSSGYRDPSAGTFYALESPVNFVYNQGLLSVGDEVFCVYVHAEERSSGM